MMYVYLFRYGRPVQGIQWASVDKHPPGLEDCIASGVECLRMVDELACRNGGPAKTGSMTAQNDSPGQSRVRLAFERGINT